jgi:hypothetical protein
MSSTDWIVPSVQRGTPEGSPKQERPESMHGEHIMALDTKAHHAVPTIPFTARIIRRAQDHVDRKLGEAVEIAETTPLLNTDSGWQLLPAIRKRSST